MRRFPHLMKSRHGVYYVRLVAPAELRRRIPSMPREVRKSLGTKDKARAHVLFCKTYLRMRHALDERFPWEVEADREKELFHEGLELIEQFNNLDPNDPVALDTLSEELSVEQLEC